MHFVPAPSSVDLLGWHSLKDFGDAEKFVGGGEAGIEELKRLGKKPSETSFIGPEVFLVEIGVLVWVCRNAGELFEVGSAYEELRGVPVEESGLLNTATVTGEGDRGDENEWHGEGPLKGKKREKTEEEEEEEEEEEGRETLRSEEAREGGEDSENRGAIQGAGAATDNTEGEVENNLSRRKEKDGNKSRQRKIRTRFICDFDENGLRALGDALQEWWEGDPPRLGGGLGQQSFDSEKSVHAHGHSSDAEENGEPVYSQSSPDVAVEAQNDILHREGESDKGGKESLRKEEDIPSSLDRGKEEKERRDGESRLQSNSEKEKEGAPSPDLKASRLSSETQTHSHPELNANTLSDCPGGLPHRLPTLPFNQTTNSSEIPTTCLAPSQTSLKLTAHTQTDRPLSLAVEELHPFGARISGLNLTSFLPDPQSLSEELERLISLHRVLVIPDQHDITPESQLEIMSWFGVPGKEPASIPSLPEGIASRSTDPARGDSVRAIAWHLDSIAGKRTFARMTSLSGKSVLPGVPTDFVSTADVFAALTEEERESWKTAAVELRECRGAVRMGFHPLFFKNPLRPGEVMVVIHPSYKCVKDPQVSTFTCNSTEPGRLTLHPQEDNVLESPSEAVRISDRLQSLCSSLADSPAALLHEWTEGDFLLFDNVAVVHRTSPRSKVLAPRSGATDRARVIHRALAFAPSAEVEPSEAFFC
uniref:TauD/TfdA-like domain-containing protein n=1 Tax=Chromera velia CCMP2878 TaxID=1169474 RepID=A0A0G4IFH6_9ALVE|eukprot:Cvel_2461.t1-p1 / transcript=Cvel_2461.t1 / gene=Cvel_2461 / organism=Chromera_velia_CCMP2878 / gene_product=hypothetical protein / transcript_product=hypothetical protein / location=Cvel_scaffold96:123775-126488(-) / protein_length=704 / sequence_SO=supercontig / SO=protein_coding / is_pseudo=false